MLIPQNKLSENTESIKCLPKRYSQNLATALCQCMHIAPKGKHLICIIGKGYEMSNLEAVDHWLNITISRQDSETQINLNTLIKKLSYTLNSINQD